MESTKTWDSHPLNSSFAAAVHPLICNIGDEYITSLRMLCKESRVAADSERKGVQISLPPHPSDKRFRSDDLRSFLSRLPALTQATISQDLLYVDLPSRIRLAALRSGTSIATSFDAHGRHPAAASQPGSSAPPPSQTHASSPTTFVVP
ncbi:hypothetical protein Agub_g1797, partial [Astrephomene gubernaculifera]